MTKLSNGAEYMNPNFPLDFGEFLIANHFGCNAYKDSIRFQDGGNMLVVKNDQVDLYVFHPEAPGQENEKWIYEQSHIGISHFSLFGWIFLMHVMGVLKISDFISNAKKAGVQNATEAAFIINTAFNGPLQKVLA